MVIKEDAEHQEIAKKEILLTGTANKVWNTYWKDSNNTEGYLMSSGGEDALHSGTVVYFWLTLL